MSATRWRRPWVHDWSMESSRPCATPAAADGLREFALASYSMGLLALLHGQQGGRLADYQAAAQYDHMLAREADAAAGAGLADGGDVRRAAG